MNGRTAQNNSLSMRNHNWGEDRAQRRWKTGYAVNSLEPFEGAKFEVYMRTRTDLRLLRKVLYILLIAAIIRANADLLSSHARRSRRSPCRAGKRTAVSGIPTPWTTLCRHAVSIAMDKRGLMDMGDVGIFRDFRET